MVHNIKETVCSDHSVTVGMRCSLLGVPIQIGTFSLCCIEPLGVARSRDEAVCTEHSVTSKKAGYFVLGEPRRKGPIRRM